MNNSSELHELIRAMDKNEKRYFTKVAKQNFRNGSNNYLEVFEILVTMEEYDEEYLKGKLANDTIAKNLPTIKYQLFKYILRILRRYQEGQSIESQLCCYLEEIELLRQKGLIQPALKILRKGISLAEKYEKKTFLLTFYSLERELLTSIKQEITKIDLDKVLDREIHAKNDYLIWLELSQLKAQIRKIAFGPKGGRTSADRNAAKKISTHRYVRGYKRLESPENRIIALEIKGEYHFFNDDPEKIFESNQEISKIFNENAHLKESNVIDYLNFFNSYVTSCLASGRTETFLNEIQNLSNVTFLTNYAKFESELVSNTKRLIYLMNFTNLSDEIAQIRAIGAWVDSHKNSVYRGKISIIYNIAIAYFMAGEFSQSAKWVHKLILLSKSGQRTDLQDFARIFQLIIHHELGNTDVVSSLARSARRTIIKNRELTRFEILIFDFLRQADKSPKISDQLPYIERINEYAVEIVDSPNTKGFPGLQEILFWSEAKLKRQPLPEFFREKIEERKKEIAEGKQSDKGKKPKKQSRKRGTAQQTV